MGKTKNRGKYQGVSLPVLFIEEIKEHITCDERYKSIAEFIRESVRDKIQRDEHDRLIKEGKIYDLDKIALEKRTLERASKNSINKEVQDLQQCIADFKRIILDLQKNKEKVNGNHGLS